ncbi:MAG: ABC transporter ATP-binding protein [Deltaproteobacteria bacterium]|nr:ABC transporter ATP-binding protein [Deltaproteobacteria bacterium]
MNTILEVNDLSMDFGGLRALDHLDLNVVEGEIAAVIGPNGAGKTTFFNCKKINGLKPNRITKKGMARTFQNIRLFSNMTVLENVMIGRHCRTSSGIVSAILRGRSTIKEEKDVVDFSYNILKKTGISHLVNEFAKNLPYGAQRRLEIARAMATEPFLLLLDEPAAGMNPRESRELDELITRLRDEDNISILMIEHDMKLVMSLSDRIFVMDYGRKIAEGTPSDIIKNPVVIKAYLGEDIDA